MTSHSFLEGEDYRNEGIVIMYAQGEDNIAQLEISRGGYAGRDQAVNLIWTDFVCGIRLLQNIYWGVYPMVIGGISRFGTSWLSICIYKYTLQAKMPVLRTGNWKLN